MTLPRRHHYVAESVQRRFANADGHLFSFDKRHSNGSLRVSNPRKLFVKRDLHTIKAPDGSLDVSLEAWYAELEGRVWHIVNRIEAAVTDGLSPSLNSVELSTLHTFYCHQTRRAPDAYSGHGVEEMVDDMVDKRIAEFERDVRPISTDERDELCSPDARVKFLHDAQVLARWNAGPQVMTALAERGLAFAIAPKTSEPLILGDSPTARMGGTGHLADDATELWLPLTPRVAISPFGRKGAEAVLALPEIGTSKINDLIFSGSKLVASGCHRTIRRIVGRGKAL